MKKILIISLMFASYFGFAQKFADKNFYLIDSLDLTKLAQEEKLLLDSCLKIYSNAKHDTDMVNALSAICENMMDESWHKYQYFQYKLIEKKLTNNQSPIVTKALRNALAAALNNIGFIYDSKGDIPKALEYYHKSLKIQEEIGYKPGIAASLNNIGNIYDKQGDISMALEYFHKSLKMLEDIGNKQGIALCLINIGAIYDNQANTQKALEYYHKSLKIQEEIGDKQGIATSLNNIGSVFSKYGDPSVTTSKNDALIAGIPKALDYYHQSLKIREEIGDKNGIAYSLNNIAVIFYNQKQYPKALEYAQKSLVLSQEIGSPRNIRNAAKLLFQIYEKQGKGMPALQMHQLFISMRDSINNEGTKKASAQQQAKYEYEKQKAIDDAQHEKQMGIEKEAKAKQKVITYSIGVGLVLLALFLVFVFNRLQITRKQKNIITEQKHLVEEKHKEITDSINYAERLQRSLMANHLTLDEFLQQNYFVYFNPKEKVSGDFYWAKKMQNNQFLLACADSTGHGVPGAIMSMMNMNSLKESVSAGLTEPDAILNNTRKIIIETLKNDGSQEGGKDGMDCALLKFNAEKTKLSFAVANNPVFIVRKVNNELVIGNSKKEESNITYSQMPNGYLLIEIKPDKMPVGKHDNDNVPFTLHSFDLQNGDVVYTLTDGMPDQFGGENGKKYMIKNLKNLFLSIADLPMQQQKEKIDESFTNWKGTLEQVDDVCVIGVRV
ncbi:MAG: tetratricopeptide repeat protein [Bacteroidota bacterium]